MYSTLLEINHYLDPGSGSFLIQLLIGGLVGASFAIRAYWVRIRAFFQKDVPMDEEEGTEMAEIQE